MESPEVASSILVDSSGYSSWVERPSVEGGRYVGSNPSDPPNIHY